MHRADSKFACMKIRQCIGLVSPLLWWLNNTVFWSQWKEVIKSIVDASDMRHSFNIQIPFSCSIVFSLQDLCCRSIVSCTPVHLIDKLPLPVAIKSHLKSFSMANGMNAVMMHGRSYSVANSAASGGSSSGGKANSLKRSKSFRPPQSPPKNSSASSKGNCKIS